MSWASFAGTLIFVFQLLFIALVVVGALIILIAVIVGAVEGFRKLRPRRPRIDNDPMI